MAPIKVKINRDTLNEQFCGLRGAALDSHITKLVKEEYFYPAVYEMIDEFENHPVTQEIEGGIEADNISETFGGKFKNSEGKNLYSFIGFNAGETPISVIRSFFDLKHKYGPKMELSSVNKKRLKFNFKVYTPNIEEIYKQTPIPWAAGLSWVRRIEIGIPGLGRFLNKFGIDSSRSGGGVQVDRELRPAKFKPVQYLSGIFDRFIKKFNNA